MSGTGDFIWVDQDSLRERLRSARPRRILLVGAAGTGKSTLAAVLAEGLLADGQATWCIGADPGTPAFGIPGALCLADWTDDGWQVGRMEPLCSLDAGRFRLPLTSAVRRLAAEAAKGVLIVDSPGVVRGVGSSELLTGLVDACAADLVIVLTREAAHPPLPQELDSLATMIWLTPTCGDGLPPTKRERDRARTEQWDRYLADAVEVCLRIERLPRLGTPPPLHAPNAWKGRQVALNDGERVLAFGEVLELEGAMLTLRSPRFAGEVKQLIVRDAQRDRRGFLVTAAPFSKKVPAAPTDIEMVESAPGPGPVVTVGPLTATLVNGVFGDPLLHLRLRRKRRSLLFDLGDAQRLPARVVHQVSDVFISHAHADHIGGFTSFMRSRLGDLPACRFYGPPDLADNIEGMVRGMLWDRIGEAGPKFEVAELHGDILKRYWIQAGYRGFYALDDKPVIDGVLLDDPEFRVRTTVLDHGTPVLAFAFEPNLQVKVRKDRLGALGLSPGPWLTELKRRVTESDLDAQIRLPDGNIETARVLAADLLITAPGETLVYATDLADTPGNREKLAALARDAHTFFCEAPFVQEHAQQARRTGHLTARACGEIANDANVQHLVAFHFSHRYQQSPERVYAEVASVCSRSRQ